MITVLKITVFYDNKTADQKFYKIFSNGILIAFSIPRIVGLSDQPFCRKRRKNTFCNLKII